VLVPTKLPSLIEDSLHICHLLLHRCRLHLVLLSANPQAWVISTTVMVLITEATTTTPVVIPAALVSHPLWLVQLPAAQLNLVTTMVVFRLQCTLTIPTTHPSTHPSTHLQLISILLTDRLVMNMLVMSNQETLKRLPPTLLRKPALPPQTQLARTLILSLPWYLNRLLSEIYFCIDAFDLHSCLSLSSWRLRSLPTIPILSCLFLFHHQPNCHTRHDRISQASVRTGTGIFHDDARLTDLNFTLTLLVYLHLCNLYNRGRLKPCTSRS
jgi:hypothetical protein